MSHENLNDVKRREPVRLYAETFNAHTQAARFWKQHRFDGGAPKDINKMSDRFVLVYNNTGSDVGRYSVLGFGSPGGGNGDGPVIPPTSNLSEFQKRLLLFGNVPDISNNGYGSYCITYESIPAYGIGRAFIDGVCPAYININDAGHQWAQVKQSDVTQLDSVPLNGSARILWRETALTGSMWALVRLGTYHQEVAPVADGTYTVGIGLTQNGTISVLNGVITAIQQAS